MSLIPGAQTTATPATPLSSGLTGTQWISGNQGQDYQSMLQAQQLAKTQPTAENIQNAQNYSKWYDSAIQQYASGATPQAYQAYVTANNITPLTGNTLSKIANQQPNQALDIIRATPSSVLGSYYQTPGYQLLFGNNATVTDPRATMVQKFASGGDPSYQFVQDEGMRQLQRSGAARGLLESGSLQRDLLKYGINTTNTFYQNYFNQQNAAWQDYNNRIQQLMGFGADRNSAQQSLDTGNNIASIAQNTGNNLASLYQNLGGQLANAGIQPSIAAAQNLTDAARTREESNAQVASSKISANATRDAAAMQAGAQLGSSLIGAIF